MVFSLRLVMRDWQPSSRIGEQGLACSLFASVRELIFGIVRSIVDTPDAVTVDAIDEGEGVRFDVRAAEGEIGSVIAAKGRTAQSIRFVLSAASMKHGQRMAVNFIEPHS